MNYEIFHRPKKLVQIKQESTPPIASFVWTFLIALKKKKKSPITTKELYEKYESFCEDTNSIQKYTLSCKFSKKLKGSFPLF